MMFVNMRTHNTQRTHTHTTQLCFDDASVTRTSLEDFRPESDAMISALRQRDVVLQIGKRCSNLSTV
jgi:hypothetical protein